MVVQALPGGIAMLRPGRSRALVLVLTVLSGVAHAADVRAYAEQLAALRAEVEASSQEVELLKQDLRADLRAAEAQRADLEAQIRREELRTEQLHRAAERQRSTLSGDDRAAEVLLPVVLDGLAEVRRLVLEGLPYRVEERLGELDRLDRQVRDGVIRPQVAAARVWQALEDELRLSRENALDRQVVSVGGREVLAEVARVGTIALYFRTDDGLVGRAVRDGVAWAWLPFDDRASRRRVEDLFDALKKQIRVGFFAIPNALPEE